MYHEMVSVLYQDLLPALNIPVKEGHVFTSALFITWSLFSRGVCLGGSPSQSVCVHC
jgi:hypothetical protein